MKMKKVAVGVLLVALCNVVPMTAYSEGTPVPPSVPGGVGTHGALGATTLGVGAEVGIVAIAVSVLGLLALAASNGSGDSTPAATNH